MAPQPIGVASTAPGSAPASAVAPGTGVGGGAATATTAPPDSVDAASAQNEQTRQDLELKLQELIECLLELSITVYDFQAESNLLVHQKIQELITQLGKIESFKDKLDMMVPWEVLSYIEDGKNPDLFSKSFIEAVAGENQFTNGKITALKSFEDALTQNLGSVFPDEMKQYEQVLSEAKIAANTSTSGAVSGTQSSEMTIDASGAVNNMASSSSSTSSGPPLS
ncbi:MAG: transcription factor subunit Med10 of mediator complex-domain-containing protein [Benniella sp.]|nr:MAG: transcription factor subunit Med10 of mediator complex-domain-containing protein [Benniella sp.]